MAKVVVKVDRSRQLDLLNESLPCSENTKTDSATERTFIELKRDELFLGMTRVDHYLKQAGLTAPLKVANLLDQLSWHEFEARYAKTGRAPYSPKSMVGVILYGVMQGTHSLRGLERFARQDLGCMWITGGICPDHASLGRFIVMHEQSFMNGLFESITRQALKATASKGQTLAGDGSIVEAACSYYKLLREEAIKEQSDAVKKQLEVGPLPKKQQAKAELALHTQRSFDERKKARLDKNRDPSTLAISPVEPDAMVQPQKRKRGKATSYKPSILANDKRVITAHQVDPSNESNLIPELLDQSERASGDKADSLLLDAGYCHDVVIQAALEREINLLCPTGSTAFTPRKSQVFPKSEFYYSDAGDYYLCPAREQLTPGEQGSKSYKTYRTPACKTCALRSGCTTAKDGRRLRRSEADEAREALHQVMSQEKARLAYSKRQGMVEPVFGYLKTVQNLTRFRRRGLQGVRREFALHVLAYNLNLAVKAILMLFALLCGQLQENRRFWGNKARILRKTLMMDLSMARCST